MRLLRSTTGAAAVEFAILAPVLIGLFVGVFDIGQLLLIRFRLDAAAAAAASYALVQPTKVNATDGAALAAQIAALARSDAGSNVATVTVWLNKGPLVAASGTNPIATSGTAADADTCYCPGANPFAWGAGVACGSSCATGGTLAGKFVRVTIARPYVPLFSSYGMTDDGMIRVASVVQTQ